MEFVFFLVPLFLAKKTQAIHFTDVVCIGSGIGGLSASAILTKAGYDVTVCESHTVIGGCAHGWERRSKEGIFKFDSGPSLFSGCSVPSSNPLRQVLDACDLEMEWKSYNQWNMYLPEGTFAAKCGDIVGFGKELVRVSGNPLEETYWKSLIATNENLASIVGALPPIALRADPLGAIKTVGPYLSNIDPTKFAKFGFIDLPLKNLDPNGPFSNVLKAAQVPEESLCYRWWNFLAFALSGLPVDATSAAACSFMLKEFFAEKSSMEVPVGGSAKIVETLASKTNKVLTNAHVKQILIDNQNRACGVQLVDGTEIRAKIAVISNAGAWGTARLLPKKFFTNNQNSLNIDPKMPATPSFMHLHLAFKASAHPNDAIWSQTPHHIIVNDWKQSIDTPDNLIFVSIPSVLDTESTPSSAYHTLHAYLPATEPYEPWKNLQRTSPEYKALKQQRAEPLFAAIERFIPDIRSRLVLPPLIGSPLTHERFTRRFQGTYGPALRAGQSPGFPGHTVPQIPGLYCCGDSTFPGIGVPAVAGSGIAVASSILSPDAHLDILNDMRARGCLPLP